MLQTVRLIGLNFDERCRIWTVFHDEAGNFMNCPTENCGFWWWHWNGNYVAMATACYWCCLPAFVYRFVRNITENGCSCHHRWQQCWDDTTAGTFSIQFLEMHITDVKNELKTVQSWLLCLLNTFFRVRSVVHRKFWR